MVLAELTSPDIQRLPKDVVWILPTGATEQHGRHLPLGTDAILAESFGRSVEQRMQQEVVLLPTVTVGFSPHHLCFPGTLSLCAETYMHLVRDTCRSILSAGFRRIYILNAHGGNAPAHEMVLRELKVEFPTAVLADPEYYYLAAGTISEVAEGHQLGHGDEIETSLMLHVAPELVQMHAAVADGLEPVIPVHALVTNANEKSIHGNDGNPLNASADLGRELHSRITDVLVADIRAFAGTITMLGRSGFK